MQFPHLPGEGDTQVSALSVLGQMLLDCFSKGILWLKMPMRYFQALLNLHEA